MKKIIISLVSILSFSHAATADMGVGFSSYGSGGAKGVSGGSLSGMMRTETMSLQGMVGLPSTTPFQFGVGGIGRMTLVGTKDKGLHAGGGLNLGVATSGATTAFFLNLFPVAGFHFALGEPLKNILLHFDGALVLTATPALNLAIEPLGGILANIHYVL